MSDLYWEDIRFHALPSVAPLKQNDRAQCTSTSAEFPRSTERGPIEASRGGGGSDRLPGFPRSTERGPIEAV